MGRRARILAAALLALALGGGCAPVGLLSSAATAPTRPAGVVARTAADCDSAAPRPAYGWPVKPFHVQHPVRGYLGDPRLGGHPKGSVKALHFGVDVSAPDGTAVYATADGVAIGKREAVVSIQRADGVVFTYWHIEPAVCAGQHVTAYRTVIGHIKKGWGHVHFAEYRGGAYVNPLRPGAMGPYADHTRPAFGELSFERDGRELGPKRLHGLVDLVLTAYDMPAMSAPAPWYGLPVTPALLQWRVVGADGRVAVGWRVAFDVRETLPRVAFSAIYTEDTTQNRRNQPGNYRFLLARRFAVRSLAPGSYKLQALATDTGGNSARTAWPFVVSA
jgi:Peptidase family M23